MQTPIVPSNSSQIPFSTSEVTSSGKQTPPLNKKIENQETEEKIKEAAKVLMEESSTPLQSKEKMDFLSQLPIEMKYAVLRKSPQLSTVLVKSINKEEQEVFLKEATKIFHEQVQKESKALKKLEPTLTIPENVLNQPMEAATILSLLDSPHIKQFKNLSLFILRNFKNMPNKVVYDVLSNLIFRNTEKATRQLTSLLSEINFSKPLLQDHSAFLKLLITPSNPQVTDAIINIFSRLPSPEKEQLFYITLNSFLFENLNIPNEALERLFNTIDLNWIDSKTKITILTAFILHGDVDAARLILEKDASHLNDHSGVKDKEKLNLPTTPLEAVAQMGLHAETILPMLIEKGANINAKDNLGRTPIMYIVHDRRGSLKQYREELDIEQSNIFQLFLDHGAEINLKDLEGKTVLDHAIEKNDEDAIQFLTEKGALKGEEIY